MSNNTTQNLISFDEVIRLSKLKGADFGKGDPYNRLRYYIKIGLLPKASRKSFNGLPPAGALPFEAVDSLVEIDSKIKDGKSIQQILKESQDPTLGKEINPITSAESQPLSGVEGYNKDVNSGTFPAAGNDLPPQSSFETPLEPVLATAAIASGLPKQSFFDHLGLTKQRSLILGLEGMTLLLGLGVLASIYHLNTSKPVSSGSVVINKKQLPTIASQEPGQTLGESVQDGLLSVFVPTNIAGQLTASGGVITDNTDVNAGTGKLTASNVIYSLTAGANVSITGGQNATISAVAASSTGTTNRITVTSGKVDIASNYAGQTSITTLGTVTTGTWAASNISDTYISDTLTINSSGSVDWLALTNFPTTCGAGNFVRAVGTTLTCALDQVGGASPQSILQNGIFLQTADTLNFITTDVDVVTGGASQVNISLPNTTVGAGGYGNATTVATFTVDTKGRLTAAGNAAIAGLDAAVITTGTFSDARVSNSLTIDNTSSVSATAINSGTLGNAGVTLALASFGSITGTLGDANVADNISLTNLTQIATRQISDTTGILSLARGGTGADLSATGGANQFVRQNSAGGTFTVSAIVDADVPDTVTASNYLPLSGGTLTGSLTLNDNDGNSGDVNLVLGDGNESGTITTNGGDINAGAGTGTFGDLVCASTTCITLGTETGGNYISAATANSGLTVSGGAEGGTVGITLGTAGSDSAASFSGLTLDTAGGGDGLRLLNCSNTQILKKSGTNWTCSTDNTGSGGVSGSGTQYTLAMFSNLAGDQVGDSIITQNAGATTITVGGSLIANDLKLTGLSTAGVVTNTSAGIIGTLAGTTTTVLHGNASGLPTFSAVSLTADVSGTLPIANGGTNSNSAIGGAGSIVYSDGTKYAYGGTTGSSGQCLLSGTSGTGQPTWGSCGAGASGQTYTDGTNPVSSATSLTFDNFFTTSGSTPNAHVTITPDILDFTELKDSMTLDANQTVAQGTNTWTQNFTGTTTTGLTYNANSLTTGSAFVVNSTNNSAANTAWIADQINITNSQGTTAVSTGSIFGLDVEFTQGTSIAGNNESVANFAVKQNNSSSTDQTVNSIINVANNDTATGNQITVTDGIRITGSNITNGINFSGTFGTNLITSTNFTVAQSGAVTAVGVNSGSGLIQGTGGLTTSGTITFSSFTTNGGLLYTNGSGVLAQTGAGSSTTVLHGGTTPSYSAVSLTADVSGTLPIANGGTNSNSAIGGAGSIVYSDGTKYAYGGTTGSANLCLLSGASGTGQPTWGSCGAGASGMTISDDNANSFSAVTDTKFKTFFTVSQARGAGTADVTVTPDILDFTEFKDTMALDANLTLNQSTNTWTQNFTGTTTTGHTYNANSLTTGSAFVVNSTNNSAANTAWSSVVFNPTNSQGTTAVSTGSIAGLDLQFSQNTSIAGNNETAARFNIAQNNSSSTDATVDSIIAVANNDTATGNQITVTDGIKITGSNITNGINFSGTFGTNLITSTNFTVAQSGNVTAGTYNSQTISSTADFTGTLNVATGFKVGGAAATGNYLRGNGTNFVSSALLTTDLSGTLFTLAGDSGSGTVSQGNTVTVAGGNGLTSSVSGTTATITVGAGSGILSNANDVAVDQAFGFTFTGNNTFTPSGSNDLTLNLDANSTLAKVFSSGTDATSGETFSVTNSNSGGSNVAVIGSDYTLVGTATSGGLNTVTGIKFENVSTIANNTFNGITFGTGFNNFLTSGTINISAAGAISGATGITSSGTITFSAFTTNGGLLYTNGSGVLAQTGAGTSTTVLHGGTTPSYSAVSLTADVTGILPLANGGTNNNITASNGQVVYSDASKFQLTTSGTTGYCLKYNSGAAPSWASCPGGSATSPFISTGTEIVKDAGFTTDQVHLTAVDAGDYGLKVDTSVANTTSLFQLTNTGFGYVDTGANLADLNFTQADDADATDTNSALNIAVTGNSADADTLNGINIANLAGSSAAATSTAINIGTSWDTALQFNGASTIGATAATTFSSTQTSGTILNLNPTSSVSLSSGLTGIGVDLTTNYSGFADKNFIGVNITTPDGYSNAPNRVNEGISIRTAGSGDITATSGTTTYAGVIVLVPNLTISSTGSAVADGYVVVLGTSTFGGSGTVTQNGLLITPPSTTNATTTTNGVNIGGIQTSTGTDNALRIGAGWDNDLFLLTDNTHTFRVQDQDTAATAGSALQIIGAAGNTTGTGGAISLTSGAGGSGVATGGDLNLTSGAGGGTSGSSGAVAIVTGNVTSGTAGNVSINVGTSTSGNGSILIGTAARAQTITIGNNSGGTITVGATSGSDLVLQDAQWGVTGAGVGTFVSGTVIGSQTFTTNNIVDSGALTINSTGANALTLDSGTTGNVNLGNGASAKTITVGNITGATTLNLKAGTGSILMAGQATGTSATFLGLPVKTDSGDPTTTQINGAIYYNSNSNKFRCYENSAWANCISAASSSVRLDQITAATTSDTDNDNLNNNISWNWSTLTTQTALTLDSTSTGLTTGGIFALGSSTTAYNHGAANTGSVQSITFKDTTSGAFASTTNGLLVSPEINITAGAATKTINGISVNPTFTACTTATCNVNGVNVANVTDSGNFNGTAINIGTGWDTVIGGTTAGTNLISFTNFTVTSAGAGTFGGNVAVNGGTITSTGTLTLDATSTTIIPNADTFQTDDVTSTGALSLVSAATNAINVNPGTTGDVVFTHGNDSQHAINNTTTSDLTLNAVDITMTNSAGASTGTLNLLAVRNLNEAGSATGTPDSLIYATNLDANETVTNGLFLEQATSGGTLTNGIQLTQSAGTFSTGINFTGTFTNLISAPNFSVTNAGAGTFASTLAVNGSSLTTSSTTFTLLAGATTTLNIGPTGANGSIVLSGGSADTGCTLDGTNGNLTCTGNITGSTSGTVGFWTRTGTSLSPATANDVVAISSNAVSAAGVLDLTASGTITSGNNAVRLTANSVTTGVGLSITTTGLTTGQLASFAPTFGGSSGTGTGLKLSVTDSTTSTGGFNIIDIPAFTSANTTATKNALNIGNLTGSGNSTENAINIGTGWDNDLFFVTDSTHNIRVQDQDSGGTNGSDLQVIGAAGNTSGAGGGLLFTAGAGGTSGNGGAITVATGAGGTSGSSGALTLATGTTSSNSNATGAILIQSGIGFGAGSTGGPSGAVTLQSLAGGAATTGTGGTSGLVTIASGNGGAASGASGVGGNASGITLLTGNGGNAGTGNANGGNAGAYSITSGTGGNAIGNGTGGSGGSYTILAGNGGTTATGTGGVAGAISLTAGNGGVPSGAGTGRIGGAVTITAGNGSLATAGGDMTLLAGTGGATGTGGVISITTGNGGATSGNSGNLTIATGTANASGNTSGSITIQSGAGFAGTSGGATGTVTLKSQDGGAGSAGTGGNSGSVSITSGNGGNGGGTSNAGGTASGVTITAGTGGNASGAGNANGGLAGSLTLAAGGGGNGVGTGNGRAGAAASFSAGAGGAGGASGTNGAGGGITLNGGSSTAGGTTGAGGGTIALNAGASTLAGTGGAVNLTAGVGGATGTGGQISLTTGGGGSTSGSSGQLLLRSGTTTSGATGAITITSGDVSGSFASGNVGINVGAGVSANGSINIGTTNSPAGINIGTATTTTTTPITLGYTTNTSTITLTSGVVSTNTTSAAYAFNANALTTGTGLYLASSSLTTGILANIAPTFSGSSGTGTGLKLSVTDSTTSTGGFNIIDIPAFTSANTTATKNAINIGNLTASANSTENAINIGTGWDNDLFLATDASHNIRVQDQDTAGQAGSTLAIQGAAGNTTGTGGALTFQAGAGGSGAATGGGFTLTSGAGGATSGSSGAITLLTGNVTSGTAGNISLDVGTSTSGQGSILIGTAARNQTITLGNTTSTATITLNSAVASTNTTSSAYAFNANSLTSGTGLYLASSSLTSGMLANLAPTFGATATSGAAALNFAPTDSQTNSGGFNIINIAGFTAANGTGGTKNAVNIGALTSSDTDVNETAVNIGDGWDTDINLAGSTVGLASPWGGFGRGENLLKYSEDFGNTGAWTVSVNTGVTTQATTAPDGNTTADQLDFNGGGTDEIANASATAAGSSTFTASVWLKYSSARTIRVGLRDQAGSPSSTTNTVSVTTGWQRFSVTKAFSGATGNAVFFIDDNGDASGAYPVWAWGAQLERQSTVGVYVPTSVTALTTSQTQKGFITNDPAFFSQNLLSTGAGITNRNYIAQAAAGSNQQYIGIDTSTVYAATAGTSQLTIGLKSTATQSGAGAQTIGGLYGLDTKVSSTANGIISLSRGLFVETATWSSAVPITTYGIDIGDQGNASATTAYGINISGQTAGTSSFGINIANSNGSATSKTGISIGTGWDNAIVANGDIQIGKQTDSTTALAKISQAAGVVAEDGGATTAIDTVSATTVYNGSFFVGTTETDKAEVYRSDGGSNWTQLNVTGTAGKFNTTTSIDGVSSMTVYNGQLYIGTNETDKAEVYRYDGGTTWTAINTTAGRFGTTTAIDKVTTMTVYAGNLYIGTTESNSAEVYRYNGGTGTSVFTAINTTAGTFNTTANVDGVASMAVYNNVLYIGTNEANVAQVLQYDGNTGAAVFTRINTTAGTFNTTANIDQAATLAVFNGALYVGTNEANNAEVYRYDGTTTGAAVFTATNTTAGTFDTQTAVDGVSSMAIYNGLLYIGTTESNAGQILSYNGGVGAAVYTKLNATAGTITTQTNVDTVSALQSYAGFLYDGTSESNATEVQKYAAIEGQSFALKFNGVSDNGSGVENNSLLNTGQISFLAEQNAFNNTGNAGTGVFMFTHGITTATGAYDVAEDYPTRDDSLAPGDVVSIDRYERGFVTKTIYSYDDSVLGVYSGNPALHLSQKDSSISGGRAIPVALVGRVDVKVSSENGAIQQGDPLTSSTRPGVAMKATVPGPIIGHALASWDNADPAVIGKISVAVKTGYWAPTLAQNNGTTQGQENITTNDLIATNLTADKVTVNDTLVIGDKITMNKDGKLSVNGEVVVVGLIKLTGDLTVSGKIDAGTVAAAEIQIKGKDNNPDATAGTATIVAGTDELVINTTKVDDKTLVFVTPTKQTDKQLAVIDKISGTSFKVKLNATATEDLTFNWLIVNQQISQGN